MLNSTYKHTITSWKWDHEKGKSSAPLRALLSSLLNKGSYIFYFALGLENDVALPTFRAYPIKHFWCAWPGQLQYSAERAELALVPSFFDHIILPGAGHPQINRMHPLLGQEFPVQWGGPRAGAALCVGSWGRPCLVRLTYPGLSQNLAQCLVHGEGSIFVWWKNM